MQEILFDPQTSGGLLFSVSPKDASALLNELQSLELSSAVVGEVRDWSEWNITVC